MAASMQQLENRPARRLYFTNEDDLHLLREVVGQNPYEDNTRWNIIQMNIMQIVGKFISVRALKDRVRNLVNKFLEKDRTLQFQSGIEEEISELDDLLRHIVDLINELKKKNSMECKKPLEMRTQASKRSRDNSSYQKGLEQRTLATHARTTPQYEIIEEDPNVYLNTIYNEIEITNDQENAKENDPEMIKTLDFHVKEKREELELNISNGNKTSFKKSTPTARNILTPTRKRAASSLKQSTLAYLTKNNDRWYEIRSRELALQEREKSLEEKKIELENFEKRKRIEMEEKKVNIELDIFKNQQRLIEIALQRNA